MFLFLLLAGIAAAVLSTMSTEPAPGAPGGTKGIFLKTLLPIALRIEKEYGIKAKIALAQWAHETGYGTGRIFRATNNLGSIVGEAWAYRDASGKWQPIAGKMIHVNQTEEYFPRDKILKTDRIVNAATGKKDGLGRDLVLVLRERPFRKYADLLSGARAWADLLKASTRYKAAYEAALRGDLREYAAALQRGGYATDPRYAEIIVSKYQNILPA